MLLGGLGLFLCGMQMMSSNLVGSRRGPSKRDSGETDFQPDPWSTCRSRHHSSHPVVIRYYRDGGGLC